ncbi:hypothetical protein Q8A73_008380 [Channa argus]|nr:hypothetical protein Q8A73_008380 [Channa argus]
MIPSRLATCHFGKSCAGQPRQELRTCGKLYTPSPLCSVSEGCAGAAGNADPSSSELLPCPLCSHRWVLVGVRSAMAPKQRGGAECRAPHASPPDNTLLKRRK